MSEDAVAIRCTTRLLPIVPRLWQLEFRIPFTTNAWFLLEGDGFTVVDTGYAWNAPEVEAAARLLGAPIRRLVVTHAHPDHAGGLAALARRTGAEVMAHPGDIPYLMGMRSIADEPGWWMSRQVFRLLRRLGWLDPRPVPAVTPIHEGDRVGRLVVMDTPGHTPGSITLWDAEDEAILCGDNAQFTFHFLHLGVSWYTLDVARRNESVRRYLSLPARRLLAGHGPVYEGDVGAALARLL